MEWERGFNIDASVDAKNMARLPTVLVEYIGSFIRIPLVECTFCGRVLCWRVHFHGQKWSAGVRWYGHAIVCTDCWYDSEWLQMRMYMD